MREGLMGCGACISGWTALPRGETRQASGGVTTISMGNAERLERCYRDSLQEPHSDSIDPCFKRAFCQAVVHTSASELRHVPLMLTQPKRAVAACSVLNELEVGGAQYVQVVAPER